MNIAAIRSLGTAVGGVFFRWIDSVVDSVCAVLNRIDPPRTVRLVENQDGYLAIQTIHKAGNATISAGEIQIVDGRIIARPPSLVEDLSDSRIDLVLRPDRFVFSPLELPNRAADFMPGIVRSQIDRLTPWNPTNAAFGWSRPVEADAETMVVTVAVTTFELLQPYMKAITDIGARSISIFTVPPDADCDAEV